MIGDLSTIIREDVALARGTRLSRTSCRDHHGCSTSQSLPRYASFQGFRPVIRSCHTHICMLIACIALLVGSGAQSQSSDNTTLIVNRSTDYVEIFLGMPAVEIENVFGYVPDGIVQSDGTVDFEPLRLGTWQITDELFESVKASIGGQAVTFEGMSMMVHPKVTTLPFVTPLDGMIAISVCTVETPDTALGLEDLHIYMGLIAYTDAPMGPLDLHFEGSKNGSVEVMVRDYNGGWLSNVHMAVLDDGSLPSLSPGGLHRTDIPFMLLAIPIALISIVLAVRLTARTTQVSTG